MNGLQNARDRVMTPGRSWITEFYRVKLLEQSPTGGFNMKSFRSSPRLVLLAATLVVGLAGAMIAAEWSASAMASAATAFVNSLSPEQRKQAVFAFTSNERLHWNYIPSEAFPRNGLMVKDMSDAQRKLAHDLLKAGLSQRGYLTATSIMDLETVLGDLEQRA